MSHRHSGRAALRRPLHPLGSSGRGAALSARSPSSRRLPAWVTAAAEKELPSHFFPGKIRAIGVTNSGAMLSSRYAHPLPLTDADRGAVQQPRPRVLRWPGVPDRGHAGAGVLARGMSAAASG